jgi:hypothetical protein
MASVKTKSDLLNLVTLDFNNADEVYVEDESASYRFSKGGDLPTYTDPAVGIPYADCQESNYAYKSKDPFACWVLASFRYVDANFVPWRIVHFISKQITGGTFIGHAEGYAGSYAIDCGNTIEDAKANIDAFSVKNARLPVALYEPYGKLDENKDWRSVVSNHFSNRVVASDGTSYIYQDSSRRRWYFYDVELPSDGPSGFYAKFYTVIKNDIVNSQTLVDEYVVGPSPDLNTLLKDVAAATVRPTWPEPARKMYKAGLTSKSSFAGDGSDSVAPAGNLLSAFQSFFGVTQTAPAAPMANQTDQGSSLADAQQAAPSADSTDQETNWKPIVGTSLIAGAVGGILYLVLKK